MASLVIAGKTSTTSLETGMQRVTCVAYRNGDPSPYICGGDNSQGLASKYDPNTETFTDLLTTPASQAYELILPYTEGVDNRILLKLGSTLYLIDETGPAPYTPTEILNFTIDDNATLVPNGDDWVPVFFGTDDGTNGYGIYKIIAGVLTFSVTIPADFTITAGPFYWLEYGDHGVMVTSFDIIDGLERIMIMGTDSAAVFPFMIDENCTIKNVEMTHGITGRSTGSHDRELSGFDAFVLGVNGKIYHLSTLPRVIYTPTDDGVTIERVMFVGEESSDTGNTHYRNLYCVYTIPFTDAVDSDLDVRIARMHYSEEPYLDVENSTHLGSFSFDSTDYVANVTMVKPF